MTKKPITPLYVHVDKSVYDGVSDIFETFGKKRVINQMLLYLAELNKTRNGSVVSRNVADIMVGNYGSIVCSHVDGSI